MFWHENTDDRIVEIHGKWREKIDNAAAITDNQGDRYEAFADAEALIIDHAIVIPFSIMSGDGYVMSKFNEFEGEYSSYGMARQRYKRLLVHEKSMGIEEYEKEYEKWLENM